MMELEVFRKRLIFTLLSCALLIFTGVGIRQISQAPLLGEAQARIGEAQDYIYLMTEYDGKVAVYEANGQKPLEVFDVYIDSLPAPDQEQLKQGVKIYSRQELQKAIEDYTS